MTFEMGKLRASIRRRGMLLAVPLAVLLVATATVWGHSPAAAPRVLVLGFDGFDYGLTRDLMAQGRMPNFSRLAAKGSFAPLGSSIPPQSPVAWSTFITGRDPGVHGIFDFVHRDPKTMTPYMSTTRTESGRKVALGNWLIPLSSQQTQSLRGGQPFWQPQTEHGIETTIIRMPTNFPPSGLATRELSGMGTPDILGTYGQFSFYTSAAGPARSSVNGGTVYHVRSTGGVVESALEGPDQPHLLTAQKMSRAFTVAIDGSRQQVKIVVGDETRTLKVGDWSDWVPISFDVWPLQTLRAECRFYLKQLQPNLELYVSPVNMDPMSPALPISTPAGYAAELARTTGRFYTQGMPEETNALIDGLISRDEFLRQTRLAQAENVRQFKYALDHFDRGFLFYYFGDVDQVSHMLWIARDPEHPAYNAARDARYAHTIDDLYVQFDGLVGEALQHLGPQDLLVVMSDHGFASWRRSFSLNAWLRNEGYIVPAGGSEEPGLAQIDFSKSRAYGLGLNGLYLNLKGREPNGTVDPSRREALLSELSSKLLAVVDPSTGKPAIAKVFRRDDVYTSAGHDDVAPDLIIGYAKGTRVSGESALGGLPAAVFADNTSAWSGDHCMDPDAVPGILLTSRALQQRAPTLQTLASSILAEEGIQFPGR